jgi:hypothetical protein
MEEEEETFHPLNLKRYLSEELAARLRGLNISTEEEEEERESALLMCVILPPQLNSSAVALRWQAAAAYLIVCEY